MSTTLTGYEALSRPFRYVLEHYPDEQPDLAAQFGVMSIPTLLVFEQGKLVRQAVGARPKAGVLELLG